MDLLKEGKNMWEIAAAGVIILGGILTYVIRLESRITKIMVDVSWIKKGCKGCQPNLEEGSP